MLMNQNFFFYLCINLGRTDTILGWNQYFVKHVKESEDAPHDKYIEPRDVHILMTSGYKSHWFLKKIVINLKQTKIIIV